MPSRGLRTGPDAEQRRYRSFHLALWRAAGRRCPCAQHTPPTPSGEASRPGCRCWRVTGETSEVLPGGIRLHVGRDRIMRRGIHVRYCRARIAAMATPMPAEGGRRFLPEARARDSAFAPVEQIVELSHHRPESQQALLRLLVQAEVSRHLSQRRREQSSSSSPLGEWVTPGGMRPETQL
jgi:hypothetical protein